MSIKEIGTAYPIWREAGKSQKNANAGASFADSIAGADTAGSFSFQRTDMRTAEQNSALEAYRASAFTGVSNVKPDYETYESENYRIVPNNEGWGCFYIYNTDGDKLGAFDYTDIKIKQDSVSGKQFLLSEHGTMS